MSNHKDGDKILLVVCGAIWRHLARVGPELSLVNVTSIVSHTIRTAEVVKAIDVLVDVGMLERLPLVRTGRGGRPPSPRFRVKDLENIRALIHSSLEQSS